jgi:hypothetical protein
MLYRVASWIARCCRKDSPYPRVLDLMSSRSPSCSGRLQADSHGNPDVEVVSMESWTHGVMELITPPHAPCCGRRVLSPSVVFLQSPESRWFTLPLTRQRRPTILAPPFPLHDSSASMFSHPSSSIFMRAALSSGCQDRLIPGGPV